MTALATAPVIHASPQIQAIDVSPGSPASDRDVRIEIHGSGLGPRRAGRLTVCDKRGHRWIEARGTDPRGDGYRLSWPDRGPVELVLEPAWMRRYPEGRHELRLSVGTAGGPGRSGSSEWQPFTVSLEHPAVRFFRESELEDRGVALAPGSGWDRRLDGAVNPCGVGRLNRAYFMFYVGASGDRTDGGPRQRQLGFALSRDGLRFQKWLAPVLSQPAAFGAGVDGICSAALRLSGGQVEAYYSGLAALRCEGSGVRTDLCRGTARDLRLWKQRRLVAGDGARLREAGRAIYPVAVLGRGRRRWVYGVTAKLGRDPWSIPAEARGLGMAALDGDVLLGFSAIEGLGDAPVLGLSDPVLLSGGRYGFLVARGLQEGPWTLEARTVDVDRPARFSEAEAVYFAGGTRFRHAALHLDRNLLGRSRWLVYLDEVSDAGSRFRVMSAEVFGR